MMKPLVVEKSSSGPVVVVSTPASNVEVVRHPTAPPRYTKWLPGYEGDNRGEHEVYLASQKPVDPEIALLLRIDTRNPYELRS